MTSGQYGDIPIPLPPGTVDNSQIQPHPTRERARHRHRKLPSIGSGGPRRPEFHPIGAQCRRRTPGGVANEPVVVRSMKLDISNGPMQGIWSALSVRHWIGCRSNLSPSSSSWANQLGHLSHTACSSALIWIKEPNLLCRTDAAQSAVLMIRLAEGASFPAHRLGGLPGYVALNQMFA
jgi:hypothetical protein